MNRAAALALVLVAALPAACSGVQDTAKQAASSAASSAASKASAKVSQAAATEVRKQVCSRVADGQVSAQDKQVLSGLVSAARAAGVPAAITTPLGQIADSTDQAPQAAVDALRKACGSAG